jgi:hypothetical protein
LLLEEGETKKPKTPDTAPEKLVCVENEVPEAVIPLAIALNRTALILVIICTVLAGAP